VKVIWIDLLRTLSGSGSSYGGKKSYTLMRKRLSDVFDITFLECVSINKFISPLNLLLYQLRYAFSIALSILKHKPDLVITSGFPHPEGLIAFAVSTLF
jgi:hypothetical protein